jgi:hypothetical protein
MALLRSRGGSSGSGARRSISFNVGGERFQLQKPFLAIHSEIWKDKLSAEPDLVEVDLEGDADGFRSFVDFLLGSDGEAGQVTAQNVLSLLHWGKEFGVDYVSSQCESFLLMGWRDRLPAGLDYVRLLELAARHDMPALYSRALEAAAHQLEGSDVESVQFSADLRNDLLDTAWEIGSARRELEQKCRLRLGDHNFLPDVEQRAELLWKSRLHRREPPQATVFEPPLGRLAPY